MNTDTNDDERLRRAIEHTLLRADAQTHEIEKLARDAVEHGLAAVCVAPPFIETARRVIGEASVEIATVVGFPLGTSMSEVKAFETTRAVEAGADHIDVVIGIGALIEGDDAKVEADLRAVVEAADGRPVKAILETSLLDSTTIRRGARVAVAAGVDYLKTSSGYAAGGATEAHVRLLKSVAVESDRAIGVKASGGIRTRDQALALLDAGADRLGTSAGDRLVSPR